ncbi:MarR family winged helix-turn-helix transcriptional regulator [Streptomyces hawaiiensis]|uniref:MarR family winged helix-turn-helix transcriptional regulator n=1 Tax=Streptomyces hawaiiensis TaxID=67305 RepID=UPI00365E3344
MRRNELAAESVLSTSGMTRLAERMAQQGLMERRPAETDGRGFTAILTDAGLRRLEEAYPHALASVRSNVMDHLVGLDLAAFARAVGSFAAGREQPTARSRRPARPRGRASLSISGHQRRRSSSGQPPAVLVGAGGRPRLNSPESARDPSPDLVEHRTPTEGLRDGPRPPHVLQESTQSPMITRWP